MDLIWYAGDFKVVGIENEDENLEMTRENSWKRREIGERRRENMVLFSLIIHDIVTLVYIEEQYISNMEI